MLEFLTQSVKNFRHTGSIWPSSPLLARAMTKSLEDISGVRRVLEVGPGTGPLTNGVLRRLRAGDQFDIVEINEVFCKLLEKEMLKKYRARHPHVSVRLHNAPIEDAALATGYDLIVCGLPFNNFPPKLVRSIFRQLLALLSDTGELVYFEYAGVRVMKAPIAGTAGRAHLKRIDAIGKSLRRNHAGSTELILGNFPPALTIRLKREGAEKSRGSRGKSARAK